MIIQPSTYINNQNQLNLTQLGKKLDDNPLSFWNFGQTFSQRICDLKTAKKQASPEKKHSYSLSLYSEVLIRLIEVIAENTFRLKNSDLNTIDKANCEELNAELNLYYQKYYTKYCKTPNVKTCMVLIQEEMLSWFTSQNLNREVITQKKMLADAGYSMMHEVKKWLNTEVSDLNFTTFIKGQAEEFLDWAETHPKAASILAADIALSCSILLDEDSAKSLLNAICARIYTKIFLDALGLFSDNEERDDVNLLKFRALADFVSYSPMLTTGIQVAKKSIEGQYHSFSSFALNAATGAGATLAAQKIARLIPDGHEKLTAFIISILRGQDLQNIIAEQRNIAVAQIAGSLGAIFKNPDSFFKVLEISLETILLAKGDEKKQRIFAQAILPTVAIVIFLAALFFVCAGKLAIGLTAFSLAIILPVIILSLSCYLTSLINLGIGSNVKQSVIQKIEQKNKNLELMRMRSFLLTNPEKLESVRRKVVLYRSELQNRFALPFIPKNYFEARNHLNEPSKRSIEVLRIKYNNKLDRKMILKNEPVTISNVVSLFNKVVNLKKIRAKLESEDSDTIVFAVAKELMDSWLQTHLEEAFRERSLELYSTNNPGNATETVESFLKNALEPEVAKMPAVFEALKTKRLI